MKYRRGEIYYIDKSDKQCGSEQIAGRPAIIVSNDKSNRHVGVVVVVYLTTQSKSDVPTHVHITSAKKASTALCEQITTVDVNRVGDYVGKCTDYEMAMIDAALESSLDLKLAPQEAVMSRADIEATGGSTDNEAIITAIAERNLYRTLYEQLLDKIAR